MTIDNGLWFYNYTPGTVTPLTIKRPNDAYFSNLWYGRLAQPGETITRQIHVKSREINRSLKSNLYSNVISAFPIKLANTVIKNKQTQHKYTKENYIIKSQ